MKYLKVVLGSCGELEELKVLEIENIEEYCKERFEVLSVGIDEGELEEFGECGEGYDKMNYFVSVSEEKGEEYYYLDDRFDIDYVVGFISGDEDELKKEIMNLISKR